MMLRYLPLGSYSHQPILLATSIGSQEMISIVTLWFAKSPIVYSLLGTWRRNSVHIGQTFLPSELEA